MTRFTVSGRYQSRDGFQEFTKVIEAVNEDVAREHVLSQLGSEHGLKRTQVSLEEVAAR